RRTLSTKLIDKEVARISISIEKELKSEENLSLVVDSWKTGAQFCNEIVEAFIMGGGLKSSVVTRWSSAWDC
ncbi:6387_t:CDS:2, partial [Entrophospora sp. SA101]